MGLLRVPIHPHGFEPGQLTLVPRTSGPKGKRVRPRRVRSHDDSASLLEQLLRAGSGQLPWGAKVPLPLPAGPTPVPASAP